MRRIIPLILMLSIVGLFSGCDRPDRYSMFIKDAGPGIYVHDSKTGKVYKINKGEVWVWDPAPNELTKQKVNWIDKTKEE